jgi:universal stress protein F
MFRRILVAVDLAQPDKDRKTVAVAASFAESQGAELRLINVRYMVEGALRHVPSSFFIEEESRTLEELRAIGANFPNLQISVASPIGSILDRVIEECQGFRADLIVVGPHSPSMAKYLLGLNASRIVQHAPVSVLVVR